MDENTSSLIAAGIDAGKSVLASSPVQKLASTLITVLFSSASTSAKELAEFKSKTFSEVAESLVKSGKMTYMELYKCRNFQKVAQLADEHFRHAGSESGPEQEVSFDFDWFMRFFDAVGNISNEDLQKLWGQVMAAELTHPKSCSLRTLDMIRNISPAEAKTFNTLCKYVLHSGNEYYIDTSGFQEACAGNAECNSYIKNIGLNYSDDIRPLIELGALSTDEDIAIYLGKDTQPLMFSNDRILCIVQCDCESPVLFRQDAYILTASGRELFRMIRSNAQFEADKEYATLCIKKIQSDYPQLHISAFEKKAENDLSPLL